MNGLATAMIGGLLMFFKDNHEILGVIFFSKKWMFVKISQYSRESKYVGFSF